MSTRRGNAKKGAPKHQNTFAFRHNPKSKLSKSIHAIPNVGLCERCTQQIEWRKKYRKYKRLTECVRCTACAQKTVSYAYHTVCTECARHKQCCAKCLCARDVNEAPLLMSQSEMQERLSASTLKERQCRQIMRQWTNDTITTTQALAMISIAEADNAAKRRPASTAAAAGARVSASDMDEEDDIELVDSDLAAADVIASPAVAAQAASVAMDDDDEHDDDDEEDIFS